MQYDLKELKDKALVALKWHGEDTRVLVHGEGEKHEVKKGDTLKVTVTQARELLSYSSLWTLEDDAPVDQPFLSRFFKGKSDKKADKKGENTPLTVETVDALKGREVMKALKKLKVSFNDKASEGELKELLKESLTAKEEEEAKAKAEAEAAAKAKEEEEKNNNASSEGDQTLVNA